MSSSLRNQNIVVDGRRTSVRLEPDMWLALAEIARMEGCTINDVCARAAGRNRASSLTAGLRVYIMNYYRDIALAYGHAAGPPDPRVQSRRVAETIA
ncbi:MAG: ribbon-helix-helix domain-containing protein [Alphaproteobacteria bacterium]